jgi:hypothetical protein
MTQRTMPVRNDETRDGTNMENLALMRFPSSQEVYCQPMAASTAEESETRWLGRLRDISAGGVTLVLRRRFEPGTSLMIRLSGKLRHRARSLPVQVVQTTEEGNSRWIIGCEFLSPPSEDVLQALIEE